MELVNSYGSKVFFYLQWWFYLVSSDDHDSITFFELPREALQLPRLGEAYWLDLILNLIYLTLFLFGSRWLTLWFVTCKRVQLKSNKIFVKEYYSEELIYNNTIFSRYQGKNWWSRAILDPAPPRNQVPVCLCRFV